jgi:hypothetical protein
MKAGASFRETRMIVKVIEKDGQLFLPLDRDQVERMGYDPDNGIEMREEGLRIVLEAALPVAGDQEVRRISKKILKDHAETFRKLAE